MAMWDNKQRASANVRHARTGFIEGIKKLHFWFSLVPFWTVKANNFAIHRKFIDFNIHHVLMIHFLVTLEKR